MPVNVLTRKCIEEEVPTDAAGCCSSLFYLLLGLPPHSQRQVKQRLPLEAVVNPLDVIVGEGAAFLEMVAREDEALLIRMDA